MICHVCGAYQVLAVDALQTLDVRVSGFSLCREEVNGELDIIDFLG